MFEGFIGESFGQETYEKIYNSTNLVSKGPFVGPGTYPDEDLMSLVKKACELLKIPPHDAIRSFGKYCFGELIRKYPQFIKSFTNPKDFLMTIDSVVHIEVRKLYRDAVTPSFIYRDPSPKRLIIEYRSNRKLCYLMEGLLDGVAEHYKTQIIQKQNTCLHKGADCCEFDLTFV
jgi:hypothetical protein